MLFRAVQFQNNIYFGGYQIILEASIQKSCRSLLKQRLNLMVWYLACNDASMFDHFTVFSESLNATHGNRLLEALRQGQRLSQTQ